MTRPSYVRELWSWVFLPLMLSGLQGGTMAVFVKKTFEGLPGISNGELNLAVGIVAAAKAIGHLSSFLWASLSHGRPKVEFVARLQRTTALFIALVALMPRTRLGLWMIVLCCLAAWMIWSGVATLRTSVWRANYHAPTRPRVAGKLATLEALLIACTGVLIGVSLDWNPLTYRIVFPVLALVGLVGAGAYSRLPFRRQRAHLHQERNSAPQDRPNLSPLVIARVLRNDRWYRGYMICMFLMGFGNLMLHPVLAIVLTEEFSAGYRTGIGIATVIPLLTMTVAIPFWSRLLQRCHVIEFRAIHVWSFAAVSLVVIVGVLTKQIFWMYVAAVGTGIGWGGGVLAWNLGHQHFAPRDRDAEYMGVHITLTGIRGTIGPLLGVLIYTWSTVVVAFSVCLAMNLAGALGFGWLAYRRRQHTGSHQGQAASAEPRRLPVNEEAA